MRKPVCKALLLFLGALAGLHCVRAEPPGAMKAQDWEIHLEFIAVILPEAVALPLLDELENRNTAAAAFEKIQAEIAAGRATRAGMQRTKSEHRTSALSQSVEEVRYPIEFELPNFPNLDEKKSVDAVPKGVASVSLPAVTFETRNTGLTLEATPEVSDDGQSLRVEGKLDHIRFLKWDEFASGITPSGTKVIVAQPRFFRANSSGLFFLSAGERILAGIHKLPDQKDTFELFFLRGSTQPKNRPAPPAK